ncbi:MAG: 4Fe-4S binding protein [Actinomycetota bacterium]
MKDSAKKMSKMLGTGSAETAAHAYIYYRYVDHYIYAMGKPIGVVSKPPESPIPEEIQDMLDILTRKVASEAMSTETSTYHGKIVPLEHAEALVTIEEDIELRDLETVIPYKVARDIVLESPQSIALMDCPCRSLQENPCEPLGVCMAVGEPFASFVVEHGVMNGRRITSEEAVEILREEDRRGHVHGAYFKDVAGGRFYAICNCCTCCCLGMQAWNRLKIPIICSSGYVARVSTDCTACGDCAEICPFGAVTLQETAVVDEAVCMGCGVCEGACPDVLISLEPDPTRSGPLDIKKLIAEKPGKAE